MAIPELRGKVRIQRPSDLNLFASFHYGSKTPLIADDWARALMGTDVRWDNVCLYHWVRMDFGRKPLNDPFGIGFEGSPEDQVINASAHIDSLNSLEELPGDQAFWQTYSLVCEKWEKWVDKLIEDGQPLPQPPPPQPQPRPTPTPVPPAPIPQPTPSPTPQPEPTPEKPPSQKFKWGVIIGLAASVVGVIAKFTPIPWDDWIAQALQWLATIF